MAQKCEKKKKGINKGRNEGMEREKNKRRREN
jgi:hypothetical protein